MSSFWRHFHSILSCRCHSGVCVIYHIKLINIFKIHHNFIYLARGVNEIFQGCCRRLLRMFWNVSKSIDLNEWKVVCARFTRNTHLTTLKYICIWHRYGKLLLTEIWMIFLFKEGTPRCLLYSMKSHKRSVLDKDPECNSRCMIFHNVWYKFLIFETKRIILENLKKTKTTTKSSWKHLVLLCSCSQIGVFSQQVRKLTSGINCRWIFNVLI